MRASTFTFTDQDMVEIFVYKWAPDESPKAAVQISHGLGEHAGRYEWVAQQLTDTGYIVYADDHRGHGKTAGTVEKLGLLGPGGWDGTVKEIKMLTDIIKKENPGLPVFLIGHSWGSFLAQDYISQFGKEIKGVILTGTNGKQSFIIRKIAPIMIAREIKKIGADTRSPYLDKLTFGAYNKPFEPAPTKFEWLSRDHAVVEKYVNDPFCGFISQAGTASELAKGVIKIAKRKQQANIPRDLPIYIMSGGCDPSNKMSKGAQALYKTYFSLGIKDASIKVYNGARHEIFNETNKEEVMKDAITWLDRHL
ncbi:MAG: alpha/beta hydrolase [Candidatus Bathyarchaeia archaeon]